MSTNTEFDAIVSGLDVSDTIKCEGCDDIATVRVSYACKSECDLLCPECFNAYCAYLLNGIVQGLLTGNVLGHTCGTALRTPQDIAQHLHPENLDGSPL
jgi:hypothetical protein